MSPFTRHIRFIGVALTVALAIGVPSLALGQGADSVRLEGRVIDAESTSPVGFVDIAVLDRDLRRLTQIQAGRDGTFAVKVPWDEDGVYLLAERIGYERTRTPFLWFDNHSFFELEIRLDREAILLAPLEVVARSRSQSPVLQGFEARLEKGLGHYITRDEIERANVRFVTDLLATVPGVRLRSSGAGLRRVVHMSRARSMMACPTQVYVDGMRLNTNVGPSEAQLVAIDDYVAPGSVEGIEVYRGLSTVPAAFLNEYADCGVVVIWTRRGTT